MENSVYTFSLRSLWDATPEQLTIDNEKSAPEPPARLATPPAEPPIRLNPPTPEPSARLHDAESLYDALLLNGSYREQVTADDGQLAIAEEQSVPDGEIITLLREEPDHSEQERDVVPPVLPDKPAANDKKLTIVNSQLSIDKVAKSRKAAKPKFSFGRLAACFTVLSVFLAGLVYLAVNYN